MGANGQAACEWLRSLHSGSSRILTADYSVAGEFRAPGVGHSIRRLSCCRRIALFGSSLPRALIVQSLQRSGCPMHQPGAATCLAPVNGGYPINSECLHPSNHPGQAQCAGRRNVAGLSFSVKAQDIYKEAALGRFLGANWVQNCTSVCTQFCQFIGAKTSHK